MLVLKIIPIGIYLYYCTRAYTALPALGSAHKGTASGFGKVTNQSFTHRSLHTRRQRDARSKMERISTSDSKNGERGFCAWKTAYGTATRCLFRDQARPSPGFGEFCTAVTAYREAHAAAETAACLDLERGFGCWGLHTRKQQEETRCTRLGKATMLNESFARGEFHMIAKR